MKRKKNPSADPKSAKKTRKDRIKASEKAEVRLDPIAPASETAVLHPVDTGTLKRASLLWIIMIAGFVYLLIRILLLQTAGYDKYQNKVLNQLTTESTVKAERGKIYDTNRSVLATNVTTYRVFISPKTIMNYSEEQGVKYDEMIAEGLSAILDTTYENVMKQTTYTKYLDRTIAREVNEDTAALVEAFIDENKLHNMIFLQAGSTRYYPHGTMACHVIGFTTSDGTGAYGLELQYDDILAGTNGRYITARDSHGNEMPYEYQSYIEPAGGHSIVTTLDTYVQSVVEEQIAQTYIESKGQNRALGIVMDVNTGGILGMAVYPGFDLNDPRTLNEDSRTVLEKSGYAEDSSEYLALKQELQLTMWSNKAVTEAYMPGSTFKMVTASMAYEEDLVVDSERFYCPGYYVVNGITIHCHKTTGHGSLTFAEGIQQSCNPVLMMMGLRIGRDRFYKYFKSFGYLEKTGIDLPGEGVSIFYTPDSFKELDLATASFGQNFKITPIQQITAVAAVANGGYLVTPHLLKEELDSDGNVVKSYETNIRRQVISTETARTLAKILEEGVAGDGGAKNAYVAGYRVAAKTGTSEKVDKKDASGREYYVCSCVGFAPADDPQVAVLILVDEPTAGVLYGSYVAAPYVANVMEAILPYLGVEARYTDKELANLALTVPSYESWTASLAEQYARAAGFDVEIRGEGSYVRSQSPAAGVKVESARAKLIFYTEKSMEHTTVKVPDLLGKTAVAANETLANRRLNIRVLGTNNYLSGTGAVAIKQDPAPGTEVEAGTVVTVTFRSKDDPE